jgi:hypothetical protein
MVELLTAPNGTPFTPLGSLSVSGFNLNYPTLEAFLAANPGWQSVAATGFAPVPGRFNGGTVTLQSSIPGGAIAEYVMIAWTGAAATLDQAILANAFVDSGPMLTTTTGSGGIPPIAATPLSFTFTGLTLAVIPEPTTLALVGLGAAALMIFRRRR